MTFEETLKDRGIEVKDTYSIKEVIVATQLSSVWVRRAITTKKRIARKITNDRGVRVWRMKREDLERWCKDLAEKDERKRNRLDNYTFERRPSEMSCNMISRKVANDTKLSKAQKDTFLSHIESYRSEWREEYEARKAKKAS